MIDLSLFADIGKWLFDTGCQIFNCLNFDFGGVTVNGFGLLLGLAIFCIVIFCISRIME